MVFKRHRPSGSAIRRTPRPSQVAVRQLRPLIVVGKVPRNGGLVLDKNWGSAAPILRVSRDDAKVLVISKGAEFSLSPGVCTKVKNCSLP
ncbi:MAG: hypothetical protein R3186_05230 [Ruegeria sp.]|nr:hypothetical protein [Ruegeria sp.]